MWFHSLHTPKLKQGEQIRFLIVYCFAKEKIVVPLEHREKELVYDVVPEDLKNQKLVGIDELLFSLGHSAFLVILK